jgi:hypothetical protein
MNLPQNPLYKLPKKIKLARRRRRGVGTQVIFLALWAFSLADSSRLNAEIYWVHLRKLYSCNKERITGQHVLKAITSVPLGDIVRDSFSKDCCHPQPE